MYFLKRNLVILGMSAFYLVSGLIFIEYNSIAGDEPFSIYFSGQAYSKIWTELFSGNNPPLYEIFLKTIHLIFGESVLVFRLPSLLFSVATLFLFFQFLKKNFSTQAAIIFGSFYCFSDYFITFSLEARGYPMLNFLICLAVITYFKAFLEKNKKAKIFLILINCLLLLTHYLSALFIVVQVISLLFSSTTKNKVKTIFTYYGLTALIMSPLILNVLLKIKNQKQISAWPGPPEGINDIYNIIWRFSNKPIIAVLVIAILFVVPAIIIYRKKRISISFKHLFFFFWFPVLFIFMYCISFKVPMFVDRYLMVLALGFYGTLSILITHIFKQVRLNWFVGFSLVLLFAITHRWVIDNKRPLDKIAAWIKDNQSKNTTQTILSDYQMLHGMAYHTNQKAFFQFSYKSADTHLLNCLSEKKIGFDFSSASTVLVVEQGKPIAPEIQSKIKPTIYKLTKEDFMPEFYRLKKYIKE